MVPNYELNDSMNEKFLLHLNSLQKKLHPIFLKYLDRPDLSEQEKNDKSQKNKILDLLSKGHFALISANSSKKKLKNMGINPKYLIVTGGPLFIEDYKKINPNLPDSALEGLKKKIERLINQLKNEKWNSKDLYFISEITNYTDKLILERLDEISKLISKEIKTIKINSWKDLD